VAQRADDDGAGPDRLGDRVEGREAGAVELVGPDVVRPLRHAVLRPGGPADQARYPGDDDPRSAHAAVRDRAGTVTAVGTVLPEAPAWAPDRAAWRIRGMAVAPDRRGQGLGTRVLAALVAHAAGHGGGLVWCNARVRARRLYERGGFEGEGPVFELPGIGPHLTMTRVLATPPPGGGDTPGLGRPDRPVPT